MSVRTKVLGLVDVILRVPPLFVIDGLLKISMGLPTAEVDSNPINMTTSQIQNAIEDDQEFYRILSLTTLKFIACLLGEYFCGLW